MAIKAVTLPAVVVTSVGQRKAVSAQKLLVYGATIYSMDSNTGTQYIGDATVTSSNGQPLKPNAQINMESPTGFREPEQFDLSETYVDSSTANAEFRVSAWVRK